MPAFPASARLPRPVLLACAAVFAAATAGYSLAWIVFAQAAPSAELGIGSQYLRDRGAMRITLVWEGSAAARAGLKPGDEILAINGGSLARFSRYFDAVTRGQPGDMVQLRVRRPGAGQPMAMEAVLQPRVDRLRPRTWAESAAFGLINLYPAVFAVVGLAVLFLRVEDRNAWLLALVFGGFIAAAPLLHLEGLIPAGLRGPLLAYKVALTALLPAVFYSFFALFPTPSPLERRFPRLKRVLFVVAVFLAAGFAGWALLAGDSQPLLEFAESLGADWRYTVQGAILAPRPGSAGVFASGIYFLGVMALGLVSLVGNALSAPTAEARRKTRVILWGTVVGVTPILLLYGAAVGSGRPFYFYPFWIWAPSVIISFLLPLSFAYAVVKHRVMEIPVLLKRSARYFLVRGAFALLMLVLSILIPFRLAAVASESQWLSAGQAIPAAMLFGVAFGLVWAVSAGQIERRVRERIDRAFFRGAYDARHILQDLADKTRAVSSREELASLLQQHIREALHPRSLAVYLQAGDGALHPHGAAEKLQASLSADSPLLKELAAHGRPWEVPPPDVLAPPGLPELANLRTYLERELNNQAGNGDVASALAPLEPECLVPLVGRDRSLLGLVVLGQRMSEEPYSDEDERLLASVASQAGVALENIGLAEKIATQLETERRAHQEIEIAREVQSKLFPQKKPPLATLDYLGTCIQARTVGGDYYDFLELGGGRVALVLADVAGKGIGAALLMANLQANLRSQYAIAVDDLGRLLRSVNNLFFESTFAERFATMFFAVYDDASRRLRYANCGHNPPLLLRATGEALWLHATTTVLGMFPEWECAAAELQLAPGDALIIYSDGVTEAASDSREFFGNQRLDEATRRYAHLPLDDFAAALVAEVQRFSGSEQEDDLTLLIARAR